MAKQYKSYTVRTKDKNHSMVLIADSPADAIQKAKEIFPRVKSLSKQHANVTINPGDDLEVVT